MGWLRRTIPATLIVLVGAGATAWLATKPSSKLLVVVLTVVVAMGLVLQEPIKKRLTTGVERSQAERDKLRMLDRRGNIRRVRDCVDPVALGVHKSVHASDGSVHSGLTPYVRRDAEAELEKAFKAGGLVIIQGPSAAGKSRLAFETMQRLAPHRKLIVPDEKGWYRKERPHRNAVIWFDDVEHHILDGLLDAAAIDAHCPPGTNDVVFLATLRAEARQTLRDPGGKLTPTAEKVLNRATVIVLESHLSDVERARAEKLRHDRRIADALDQSPDTGFAEYIAAGPAALAGWEAARQGENITAGAIISAAVDARRAGYLSPLPRQLLEELHVLYLGKRRNDPHRPTFDEGLAWALKPVRGATSYLTPDDADRYSPFDYLIDHTQATGTLTDIPTDAWPILLAHATRDDLKPLGVAAYFAEQKVISEQAWRRAANAGNTDAMYYLGFLLDETGHPDQAEDWYRRAANAGNTKAMYNLGVFLTKTGHPDQAEDWYRRAANAGNTNAMNNLGLLLDETGHPDQAEDWYRRAANAGNTKAMDVLHTLHGLENEHRSG